MANPRADGPATVTGWDGVDHTAPVTGWDGIDRLAGAIRDLQNAYSEAAPPAPALGHAIAAELEKAVAILAAHAVAESARAAGQLRDLPGYGQILVPVLSYLVSTDDEMAATLTCGPLYLGSRGALHGGVVPLIFDDVMGRLVNRGQGNVYRTAYLNVNFRAPAPVGGLLRVSSRVARAEGRKRWLVAELTLEGSSQLLADAEGLFVIPRALAAAHD